MKNYRKLLISDYKKILELILETKQLTNPEDEELYDKISHQYLKGLKVNYFKTAQTDSNEISADILAVIIEILSTLTGTPENEMNESSKLDSIKLTSIKRQRARQHINTYIKENGFEKYVSSSEIIKCKTIKDLLDIVKLKMQ